MPKSMSGQEIRQSFIDFFNKKYQHKVVASSPLVPADDATLLFTNSGMVQFVDVFLGTGTRPYSRAVNSQKCLRVAGKHNDLDDVGRNDTHHTFFEMLGSWSFGDYYKKEAIDWAWELLTEVWELPKEQLYASVFRDEKGEIPTDEEAAEAWKVQPGFDQDHLVYLGRKDNFWEMANTGPCGPNSEIHIDLGDKHGELSYKKDGQVDLDGPRFVELWNLVFIQYNRMGPSHLDPLPAKHVDTGMGLDRIVSVIQGLNSNYETDLFSPIIEKVQKLAGQSKKQREKNYTPYRVIADHSRAAAFLIADGVIPGNLGRNYVTRMIIRRAARFGSKLGLNEPFLAEVAETIIEHYGDAFPELVKARDTILDNLTREEERFQRTIEGGMEHLESLIIQMDKSKNKSLDGAEAFDLYATYGLPLEITKDILEERDLLVDEDGFKTAMENHRQASGAGQGMGDIGGQEAGLYKDIVDELRKKNKLPKEGVAYNPYNAINTEGEILALVKAGSPVKEAKEGDKVAVLLPQTPFYVASGGQISDQGEIRSANGKSWRIQVNDTIRPAAGAIVHLGEVMEGNPKVGDAAQAEVAKNRRQDIMRNHSATHLLHAALHKVIGEHAQQAGSLVAPDRLRFDFNHSEAVTRKQLDAIEDMVNHWILDNHSLNIQHKTLEQAKKEGAIALFGEKYGEEVRTITIGDPPPFSYELCGGTHVERTADIGTFLIASEGSAAAGIRRIEAITGRAAYAQIQENQNALMESAGLLKSKAHEVPQLIKSMQSSLASSQKELSSLKQAEIQKDLEAALENIPEVAGVPVLTMTLPGADTGALRNMADRFRQRHPSGVALLAGTVDGKPSLVASVSKDLIDRGLHAGDLVKIAAKPLGGSGGGRPDMAQAGGKDSGKIDEALALVPDWVKDNLK